METPIKAAGYVRVSTPGQVDEESLTTQRKSITDFIKQHEYILTQIYADEGISGGSVHDRHGLLQCLQDGQAGKFNIIIIHRLSRFGRNARELLINYEELRINGIELRSISEGIDFSSKYGKAMLGMLAVIAELEKDIIKETMLENRVARGKRGIPTAGTLPYGRTFNKETGEWKLDEEIAQKLRWVAEEYLKGGSLMEIAQTTTMSYANLLYTLVNRCGDEWTVRFKGEEPITYIVPRILSEDTIQQVKDRVAFNRVSNRTDVQDKYVLSGFIRCDVCHHVLAGQTFRYKDSIYSYYTHRPGKYSDCRAFTSILAKPIEKAVFETIFENINDVPRFEKAIAESIPDKKMIVDLELKIKTTEKELRKIKTELDKLVDIAIEGTLSKETIRAKEQTLLKAKIQYEETLTNNKIQLNLLPDVDSIRQKADTIRRLLLEKFSGKKHLSRMSYKDKRTLLHWLFEGKDHEGTPYGIYINKKGKGKEQQIDYFIFGKIQGLRTLKGDDINYINDQDIYNTNKVTTNRP